MTAPSPEFAQHLLVVARRSIEGWLKKESYEPGKLPGPEDTPRGCFVTLWSASGDLRGCIGHIEPIRQSLTREVAELAVLAAARDPRFPAVNAEEYPSISLEISLLSPPEPAPDLGALDPKVYGVVVRCGNRRGVLLPDIDGVDTVEQQIDIARRKGHIGIEEPWQVDRFVVDKICEKPHAGSCGA